MNIAQAKRIPIEEYLLQRGYVPQRRTNRGLWYQSPFRNESTPSFKVNQERNAWYDFGIGKGGDVLDLVKQLEGVATVSDALDRLAGVANGPVPSRLQEPVQEKKPTAPTEIVSKGPVRSRALVSYLQGRGIHSMAARSLVQEIRYRREDRDFFGLGFANDSGGMEVRTKEFKGSIGSKDITTLAGQSDHVLLFEGFIDFLSYVEMHGGPPAETVIVLNSVVMREKAMAVLNSLKPITIDVFRDRDCAGEQLIEFITAHCPNCTVMDRSSDYPHHKDVNDWLQARSASQSSVR